MKSVTLGCPPTAVIDNWRRQIQVVSSMNSFVTLSRDRADEKRYDSLGTNRRESQIDTISVTS